MADPGGVMAGYVALTVLGLFAFFAAAVYVLGGSGWEHDDDA